MNMRKEFKFGDISIKFVQPVIIKNQNKPDDEE